MSDIFSDLSAQSDPPVLGFNTEDPMLIAARANAETLLTAPSVDSKFPAGSLDWLMSHERLASLFINNGISRDTFMMMSTADQRQLVLRRYSSIEENADNADFTEEQGVLEQFLITTNREG